MSDLALRTKVFCFSSVTDITKWFLIPPSISKRVSGVNRPEREVRAPRRFVLLSKVVHITYM
jgi:hypothetical protein